MLARETAAKNENAVRNNATKNDSATKNENAIGNNATKNDSATKNENAVRDNATKNDSATKNKSEDRKVAAKVENADDKGAASTYEQTSSDYVSLDNDKLWKSSDSESILDDVNVNSGTSKRAHPIDPKSECLVCDLSDYVTLDGSSCTENDKLLATTETNVADDTVIDGTTPLTKADDQSGSKDQTVQSVVVMDETGKTVYENVDLYKTDNTKEQWL